MKKLTIKDGYSVPIIATGSVYLTVQTHDGEYVFTVNVQVVGDTRQEQEEFICDARIKLAGYLDMINHSLDLINEHDTILAGQTQLMTELFGKMKALREVLP